MLTWHSTVGGLRAATNQRTDASIHQRLHDTVADRDDNAREFHARHVNGPAGGAG